MSQLHYYNSGVVVEKLIKSHKWKGLLYIVAVSFCGSHGPSLEYKMAANCENLI